MVPAGGIIPPVHVTRLAESMIFVPTPILFADTVQAALVPPSKFIVDDPVVTRLAIVPVPP